MSYRKKHLKNKIQKIKPKKPVFKKLWFWILVLIFAIIISGFYFLFFYPGFQLKNILISGNQKVKTEDLESVVLNDASTGLVNFWKIKINSKSLLFVDDKKINTDILKSFPEIGEVKINKNFLQTITLNVSERKPIGEYCQADNSCFSIDADGVVFDQVSAVPENVTIVRQALENGQVFSGEQIINQNIISSIDKIQQNLKDNFKINLTQALITSPVRLDVITSENWKIYFDLDPNSDIGLQITKLNVLLNGGISAVSRKKLRYIDLRPKDRAIVCDNSICQN